LANNRNRILGLLQRLTGLGPAGSLQPPALFAKFTHWLGEVAAAKDEEMSLMTRIENIEREHRFMRLAKRLKHAAPRQETAYDHPYCNDNKRGFLRGSLLLILLWYLFMRQKINQKKQGLTVD
jgi:hypothetical protein